MTGVWPCHFVYGVILLLVFIIFFLFDFDLTFHVLRVLGIGWEGGNIMDLGES